MILDEYIKYHGIGSHCTTTILRTLTNAAGYSFSEAYCLGLGSGLGFLYQKYTGVNYYFFSGRNECLEENLVNVLGGKIIKGTADDPYEGWKAVCDLLKYHIPVILEVDMMKLPYIREQLKLTRQFHFGLHAVLLIGYNGEFAYLLDYMWNKPQKVLLSDLFGARNSQDSPVKPYNKWKAIFIQNNGAADLSYATREAIRINVHKYKEPYAFKMGLEGLRVFVNELEFWLRHNSLEVLKDYFYMMYVLFEKVGTGGGNFRRMYGVFIDEAGRIMKDYDFREVSSKYTHCFRMWRTLANLLGRLSETDNIQEIKDNTDRIMNYAKDLYQAESEGLELLSRI